MRNSHLHFLSPSHNTYGETDGVHWWEEEHYINTNKIQLQSTGKYKFTDCRWEHCTSDLNGGAICLTASGSTLTVHRGTFIDCNTTEHYGGGIYIENSEKLDAQDSFFYQCHAKKKIDWGGGCICIYYGTVAHVVQHCAFIDSDCESDAGAISIYCCSGTQSTLPIQSSTFIQCKSLSISQDGGAVCYCSNSVCLGMQNCLFSRCSAENGGAIWMTVPTTPAFPIITFSFFHDNTATGDGKDICFYSPPSNYLPLLHCFSTSSGKTVGEYQNPNDHSDWLPPWQYLRCPFLESILAKTITHTLHITVITSSALDSQIKQLFLSFLLILHLVNV